MKRRTTFAPEYLADAREWFEEVLRAARDVHVIGERRAAEGILLSLDRWLLAREVKRGPIGTSRSSPVPITPPDPSGLVRS